MDADYSVSARGRDFVVRALYACSAFNLTWKELLTARSTAARRARRGLRDYRDFNNALFETFTVCYAIQQAVKGETFASLPHVVGLLARADLLTVDKIDAAASIFGVPAKALWDLIAPEDPSVYTPYPCEA